MTWGDRYYISTLLLADNHFCNIPLGQTLALYDVVQSLILIQPRLDTTFRDLSHVSRGVR